MSSKSTYHGYTEARKKANAAWNQKQAQIVIRVSPSFKEQLSSHISNTGESLVGFIVRATTEQIKRDLDRQTTADVSDNPQ